MEVIRLTGKPFSEQRVPWKAEAAGGSQITCLLRPPDDLRRRINVRVDDMFAQGLVEETRRLLDHGLPENQNAMQAIGYRQVVEHLRGERGLSETIEQVKARTRKFAKRQLTWFRGHGHCRWIELRPDDAVSETWARIAAESGGNVTRGRQSRSQG